MTDLWFEKVEEELDEVKRPFVYFRRGRCKNFLAREVGQNSECIEKNPVCSIKCRISGNKGKELYRALQSFTGEKFNRDNWSVINPKNINIGSLVTEVQEGESKERCFCSQTINQLRYAIYEPTNEIILIGSECVYRFMGRENQKIAGGSGCIVCDTVLDKRKKYHRDGYCSEECLKSLYRICSCCNKLSILKSNTTDALCKECCESNNINMCNMCNNFFIPDESWKTVCKECYKKNKNKFRKCVVCFQMNIKDYEPSWKTKCASCYKKSLD
jgi:hypothetical protein